VEALSVDTTLCIGCGP